MPDIAAELITYLKTIPAVTNLIGSGAGSRIYSSEPKQGVALPFVVFTVFVGGSTETLGAIAGMADNRIQIDCYGATSAQAFEVAEAIRYAPLQMYRGAMGAAFAASVTSLDGYARGYDQATTGGNQRRYWVSRDYDIYYSEAISQ